MITRRQQWFFLAAIILLGIVSRFWELDQLPPGLWFDEAWIATQVRDLGETGTYPLYFAADFGGLHPAIGYLTWLSQKLIPSPLAVRYGVAAVGVLSLPLTFWALQAIFELQKGIPARKLALLGTLILTITFPVLVLTRIGFETYLPALPACLAFGGLARALHTQQKRYWLLVGLGMGLAPYGYIAGRILLVAILLSLGSLVLFRLVAGQMAGKGFLLAGLVAGILLLPLALWFGQHAKLLTTRSEVASYNTLGPGADSVPIAILKNSWQTVAGFSLPGFGDQQARHNLPGRAIFDPFLSLLFWLGIALCIGQLAKRGAVTVPILLLVWGGVMLLPTILSDGAPTFTRILGGMPAYAGLCVWGSQKLPPIVLGIGLLFSSIVTGYDYFGRWANDPRLYDAFQVAEWTIANFARNASQEQRVYLVPDLVNEANPTFDLLLQETTVQPFDGATCLVYGDHLPQPILYLVDLRTDAGLMEQLARVYPTGEQQDSILHGQLGYPIFGRFYVPAFSPTTPVQAQLAQFSSGISLWGFNIDPLQPIAGESIIVDLYWQSAGNLPKDYTVLLHAYPNGKTEESPLTQADAQPCAGNYPTTRWLPNEIILDRHLLPIPPEWAAESLTLAIGWYEWTSGERLSLQQAHTPLTHNRLQLLTLPTPP